MKKQLIAVVLWGLLGGMVYGMPFDKAEVTVQEVLHVPSGSQLSAMFGQAAPQLSTQLQRVVTVGELHEGYGNGLVKVYYRGLNQDGLEVWEVRYSGSIVIAVLDGEA